MRAKPSAIFLGFLILTVANVALPKGGVAFGGVPVTFGYMLLGAMTVPALFGLMRAPHFTAAPLLHFAFGFLPLGMLTAYKVFTFHTNPLSMVVNGTLFLLLPMIFLLLLAPYAERLTERQIATVLTWSIRFAVAWGLMNFFLYAVAHQFVSIPYITANAADAMDIFSKNNRRGSLMKLVSTYNNGNIFGACMVMLTPLYILFERSPRWKIAFALAIVLTLSRSAWFGLAGAFMIMLATGQVRITSVKSWLLVGVGTTAVMILLPYIGWKSDTIIDSDLGGRMGQIDKLDLSFFGGQGVHITEIVYAGLLQSFGVGGMVFALMALGFPAAFAMAGWSRLTPIRRAAMAGVLSYLLIAASDGAIILAPIMAQFLFLCILVYRRGFRPASAAPAETNAWQTAAFFPRGSAQIPIA